MRQLVARQLEAPFVSGTSTASDATTLTDLPVLGTYADNFFIGAWVYYLDATVKDRRVTDSVQSTGVLTHIVSDNNGKDGTDLYEILPYSGTAIHQSLDDSLGEAYDNGWLAEKLFVNHWVTGSPIYNSTWDFWTSSSVVDGWTATTVTIAQVHRSSTSTMVVPGNNVVAFSGSAGTLALDEEFQRYLSDLRGQSVMLRAWVFATAATQTRIQLVVDGTTSSSSYHSGGSQWEVLTLSVNIASTARVVLPQIDAGVSGTNQCGAIWLENTSGVREYPIPIDQIPDGPDAIYAVPINTQESDLVADVHHGGRMRALDGWGWYRMHEDVTVGTNNFGILVFHKARPRDGYRLWMPSSVPFTLPTTDAGNIALNVPDDLLIAKMTAKNLLEKDMRKSGDAGGRLQRASGRLQDSITELIQGRGADIAKSQPLGRGW